MRQKYDVLLEPILQQFVEGIQDLDDLEQKLRALKPGQLN
jgi:hypothetical protein